MSSRYDQAIRGLWRRADRRKVAAYLVATVIVAASIALLGREVAHHIRAIETWLAGLGVWAPVVYVGLVVVLTTAFVPDTALSMVAGALFGLQWGVAVIVVGGLIGASVQYVLARHLFAPIVQRVLDARPTLRKVQAAVRRDELRMQTLLRLTPLNPTVVTLVLSAAGVRFGTFIVACAALVPAWFTQVYFGYVGKHVASAATGAAHTSRIEDATIVAGLAAMVAVIVLVSRAAQRAIAEATEDDDGA